MTTPPVRPTLLERLGLAAAIVLAGLALVRTFIWIVPLMRFDVDPAVDPWPAAGWGPAQTLSADTASLLLAAFIYWVSARRARAADAIVALCALLPSASIAIHGLRDADDLWRGVGWLAAFVSAAALWTAVRTLPKGGALRASLIAVLVAVAGPLLLCAASQIFMEHAATVESFQKDKAAILAARGWAVDSPSALMYERRLMQAETTGWFGLSNVMSSFAAALAVALGGLAMVGWKHLERGTAIVLAAAALACLAVVGINASKGAIGALAVGAVAAIIARRQAPRAPWAAAVGMALVVAALAAVVIRGAIGDSMAELSLRFRWQYLQGAAGAWWLEPVFGAGPSTFAQAYLQTRPIDSPEEVISAHSMGADWIAALGLAGFAWCGVALAWLWSAGRPVEVPPLVGAATRGAPPTPGRRFLVASIATVLIACMIGCNADFQVLTGAGFIFRFLGGLLAVALVIAVVQTLELPSRSASASLFGAVVVLMVHAQIEMTAWNPSSVGWMMAFIAVTAAHWRADPLNGVQPVGLGSTVAVRVSSLACASLAAGVIVVGVLPARAEEALVDRAALPMVTMAEQSRPTTPSPAVRMQAAETLTGAEALPDHWARRALRVSASLKQWTASMLATPVDSPAYRDLASRALAAADTAVRRTHHDSVLGAAQTLALVAARSSDVALAHQAHEQAANFAQLNIEISPRDVGAWIVLGTAREALGEAELARQAYRSALEADATFALDPLDRLPAAERAILERRAGVAPQP